MRFIQVESGSSKPKLQLLIIYYKKIKISYNQIITPTKMSSQLQEHENNAYEMKRKKRGDSRFSKQTPKYQCYCDKFYLSYPALYLHLKNKHPQCFLNNRKIQVTKFKESMSPDGFKILRMEKQSYEPLKVIERFDPESVYKQKSVSNYQYPNFSSFPFPNPQNYVMPPMQQKPPYYIDGNLPMSKSFPQYDPIPPSIQKKFIEPQAPMVSHLSNAQSSSQNKPKQNFLSVLNSYYSQVASQLQLDKKESLELQILFTLLVKCIKQKSEKISNLYGLQNEGQFDLTHSENLDYLKGVLPYFRTVYLSKYLQESQLDGQKPISEQQKLVNSITKFNQYLFNPEMATREIQRFQQWLISHQLIENIEFITDL